MKSFEQKAIQPFYLDRLALQRLKGIFMAVAAAEQQNYFDTDQTLRLYEPPFVVVVPELPEEEFIRHQADRLISYAGQTALSNEVTAERSETEFTSLMDALYQAVEGNEKALKLVEANVSFDATERTIKTGDIKEAEMEVVDQYKVFQHGQSMDSIQENTIRYASDNEIMLDRSKAEVRNHFRIQSALRQDLLYDGVFVVFSRAEKLPNFFTDTMTCVIQATSMVDGVLKTESAFVAGKYEPRGVQHDEQTIVKVGESLELDYAGLSPAEIIDKPGIIDKKLMPNGVVDLVKLFDDCAGGTFFGEAKPKQDYQEYKKFCKEREASYAPKTQQIVGELLAATKTGRINSPIDAAKLLDKLSDKHMVEQAICDETINPLVFGAPAAEYIVKARLHYELGNIELAQSATRKAQTVSESYSCPSGIAARERNIDSEGQAISEPGTETWHGGKKYNNSKCNSCKKLKVEVGACHICEDCVKNPHKMQIAYRKEKTASEPASKVISLADMLIAKDTNGIRLFSEHEDKLAKRIVA